MIIDALTRKVERLFWPHGRIVTGVFEEGFEKAALADLPWAADDEKPRGFRKFWKLPLKRQRSDPQKVLVGVEPTVGFPKVIHRLSSIRDFGQ